MHIFSTTENRAQWVRNLRGESLDPWSQNNAHLPRRFIRICRRPRAPVEFRHQLEHGESQQGVFRPKEREGTGHVRLLVLGIPTPRRCRYFSRFRLSCQLGPQYWYCRLSLRGQGRDRVLWAHMLLAIPASFRTKANTRPLNVLVIKYGRGYCHRCLAGSASGCYRCYIIKRRPCARAALRMIRVII